MTTMGRPQRQEEPQEREVSDVSSDEHSQREIEYYESGRRLSPTSRNPGSGSKKRPLVPATRKIK